MPAISGQQLRLLYRIDRGHGPLLQTFNNNVCIEFSPVGEGARCLTDFVLVPTHILGRQ